MQHSLLTVCNRLATQISVLYLSMLYLALVAKMFSSVSSLKDTSMVLEFHSDFILPSIFGTGTREIFIPIFDSSLALESSLEMSLD